MAENKTDVSLAKNLDEMVEFVHDGIVSKTIVEQPHGEVILFCMVSGQSLSEHTSSSPAAIHILRGRGVVQLEQERHQAEPGMWFYMPANLVHAVDSEEDLVFLLTLFSPEASEE